MISQMTHGDNFKGLLDYLFNPDKRPEIIAPYMFGDNPTDLAQEFNAVASFRPTTRLPVRHISLSFAPGDVVDRLDQEAIFNRVMTEMGYENCQYIGITHHRDDPGHDLPHDHDHLHIVANAVNVYGQRVSDSWDRLKIQPILREIERDFGLKQVKNSWEVKKEKVHNKIHNIDPDLEISKLVDRSLVECPNLETWLDRLEESQIDVRFALRKDNKVNGITYLQGGKAYKGSEIGASWGAVEERIPTTPTDIPLILAANAKSQEHRIDLGALDRQNFDRAAMMANLALKTKGRDRLKTGRLDIKRDGKTVTAYRLRPHRQILKAIETQKGWEPVGYPNIDRQDLNLLAKISGYKDEPAPIFEEKDRLEHTIEVYPNAEREARPERDPIQREIDRYPLADYQERSDQTFATLPETAIRRVLPDEIEFDVEELAEKIKQSFADTLERVQQDNLEYSQKLQSTFGALRSGKQPEPKVEVETIDSPQLEAVDKVERDRELPKPNNIAVTLKQIIDLKNYYLKSPEGKARSGSIDAQKKFNRYKLQISKDGKAVTNNRDLKMTNEFFEGFKSDRVTLLPEDRANLEAANEFAAQQAQIALQARQESERQPKQRSRGFSR